MHINSTQRRRIVTVIGTIKVQVVVAVIMPMSMSELRTVRMRSAVRPPLCWRRARAPRIPVAAKATEVDKNARKHAFHRAPLHNEHNAQSRVGYIMTLFSLVVAPHIHGSSIAYASIDENGGREVVNDITMVEQETPVVDDDNVDDNDDEIYPASLMVKSFALKPRTEEVINLSRADLDSADYAKNDLTGAVFAESSLSKADFSASDMRGAIFSRAVIFGAKLSRSDCTDALFDYVVLRGADLRQSLFINANFIRSDVEETQIEGADFTDAVFDKYQLRGLCENAKGVNEFTKIATYDSLKCDAVLANVYKGFGPSSGREVIIPK